MDGETDRLIIINLNGETDPQKMRLMREVATIGQEYSAMLGRPGKSLPCDKAAEPVAGKPPASENIQLKRK
jgi:hypothetical protein